MAGVSNKDVATTAPTTVHAEGKTRATVNMASHTTYVDDYPFSIHSISEARPRDSESFIYSDLTSVNSARMGNIPVGLLLHHNSQSGPPQTETDFLDARSSRTVASSGKPRAMEMPNSPLLVRRSTFEIAPSPREHHRRSKSSISKVRLVKERLNQHNGNYHSLEEPLTDLLDEDVLNDLVDFSYKQNGSERQNDRSTLLPPYQLVGQGNSPHDYKPHSHWSFYEMVWKPAVQICPVLLMAVIFGFVVNMIVLRVFNNQLHEVRVESLENVLISEDILLVDIVSSAINPNFQQMNIWDMDLDIFLSTDRLEVSSSQDDSKLVTILLGSTQRLLTPFEFHPSSGNTPVSSTAQLKLYRPGQSFKLNDNYLTHEQWLRIFNSKFKLIVRGNLKYHLPFSWEADLVNVNAETLVNSLLV